MFDLTKPVQLRDGTPARIISTEAVGIPEIGFEDSTEEQPILAYVETAAGGEFRKFNADGRYCSHGTHEDSRNLVNAPERITFYVNVGYSYKKADDASRATAFVWPVLKIEAEVGEGDDITKIISAEVVD